MGVNADPSKPARAALRVARYFALDERFPALKADEKQAGLRASAVLQFTAPSGFDISSLSTTVVQQAALRAARDPVFAEVLQESRGAMKEAMMTTRALSALQHPARGVRPLRLTKA
jgi:hypothetical protein